MIRADMIPDQVVEALHTSLADDAGALVPKGDCVTALAAAINAWPDVGIRPTFSPTRIILPLPQEVSDE